MIARRFPLVLAALAMAAFAVRLVYGLIANVPDGLGDDVWYHVAANNLVEGRGFSDPFTSLDDGRRVFGDIGEPIPTAFHLPLFPGLLAVFSKLGLTSYTAHQAMGWAFGTGTVVLAGLAGRRLWDERAGVAAAAIAAFYPPLVANDSILQCESLYGLAIAAVLLLALRLREDPSAVRALALGAALAAAALTRGEALGLAVLLLPWVALRAGGVRNAALAAAAVAVICAPWVIRNNATFDRPVLLTTVEGSVVAGANLPSTYYGSLLGGWDAGGLFKTPAGRTVVNDEAVQSDRWHDDALDYAGDHRGRVPLVVAVRVLRTWSLYPWSPVDKAHYAADYQSRPLAVEYAAFPALLAVAALTLAGGVGLRRRGAALWPFVAPLVLVTAVSALAYGDLRFRQAADVAMVVLAGVGVAALLDRRQPATAARRPPPARA